MTQQEIFEFNKRCAEFLGYSFNYYTNDKTKVNENIKFVWGSEEKIFQMCGCWWRCSKTPKNNFSWLFPTDLEFHSDWKCIMEVVEAIEDIQIKGQYIYSIEPRGATCQIKCSTQYSLAFDVKMPCIYEIAKSKKEAVVQAINQFLIWYEQSKLKLI